MAIELSVNHPDFPEDFEWDCDGILVPNGQTVTLTKEDEAAFISRWGNPVDFYYGEGEIAKSSGESELSADEVAALTPPSVEEPEAPPEEPPPAEPPPEEPVPEPTPTEGGA